MSHFQLKKHHIDGLLALLLFCVFAACILSVLLTGADVYRRLNARDQEAYGRRTSTQYIATKVRQAAGAVSVAPFGDGDALFLKEDIDGASYITRVYCHDGWLRELFASADEAFDPQDGEKILEAQSLELQLADGLLSVRIVDENGSGTGLTLSLRCGEEEAP